MHFKFEIFVQCFEKETFCYISKGVKTKKSKRKRKQQQNVFQEKNWKERISLPSQFNRACSHNGLGVCSHGGFLSSDTVGCTFKIGENIEPRNSDRVYEDDKATIDVQKY